MKLADLDLLRPLWHPQSFIADEDCRQGVKLWLTDGNYYIDKSTPRLSLYFHSVDEVKKHLSYDAFRFAAHAVQTIHEMEKGDAYNKLTSWKMIQVYYASFYAAHSILRFFGKSFSHLENGHVQHLKNRCQNESTNKPTLPSTYYLISFSHDNQIALFEQNKESHKHLWRAFLALIQQISQDLLKARASETRRQELSQEFSSISDSLTDWGNHPIGNWLSTMRNEVNYKSFDGAWFPFNKSIPDFDALMRPVRTWRNGSINLTESQNLRNQTLRFFYTSFNIVHLCIIIALDYCALIEKNGSRSSNFSKLIKLSAST